MAHIFNPGAWDAEAGMQRQVDLCELPGLQCKFWDSQGYWRNPVLENLTVPVMSSDASSSCYFGFTRAMIYNLELQVKINSHLSCFF